MQLVQTEDHVMILNEMVHTARIIPYADDFDIKQGKWEGNSIARWEDDTLVIETKGWYHTYNLRGMSNEAYGVERFRRADDNTLEYDFTVTDPLSWAEPWSALVPLRASPDPGFAYGCPHGHLRPLGILAGWRRYEVMGFNGDGSPKSDTGVVPTSE